jgi:hypothetical protein
MAGNTFLAAYLSTDEQSCFGNPEPPAAGKRVIVSIVGQCTQRIGQEEICRVIDLSSLSAGSGKEWR